MITHQLLIDAIRHRLVTSGKIFNHSIFLKLAYQQFNTKGHTYYKLGNTFSLTKWMGLNSFWSFSWRYSLVYWLIVKILSSRFDLSPSLEKTASTWSKPHYCVPNFFFPVLPRETNLSKQKYIRDEERRACFICSIAKKFELCLIWRFQIAILLYNIQQVCSGNYM